MGRLYASDRFPQPGIPGYEPRRPDVELRGVAEHGSLIPVRGLAAALVTLLERLERAGRHIEPGGRRVRGLTDLQGQPPDRDQIRRRREAEIEVDAPFEARDRDAVQVPRLTGPPNHELDGP